MLKIKPDPDFKRIERVLRRQGPPDRVPFFELFSDIESEVMQRIDPKPPAAKPDTKAGRLNQHIRYMTTLGYDYINVQPDNFNFPIKKNPTALTAQGARAYYLGGASTIANRQDFDRYPWPVLSEVDYSPLEKVKHLMPAGMKVIASSPGGVLENVMWLLGFEGISYLIYEDEALVRDTFEAVGDRLVRYFDNVASYETVGAVVVGDDMGFKTQTMLSPRMLREYLFPWHRKIVQAAHRHNKPIILHACGNLSLVMEDIIACGWDAKHSFEDNIEPVWAAKVKYGPRLALLGGFDMDKLCRMTEDEVRTQTRFLIEKCAPNGGWALGTGNSVANYVPIPNFLAMLEEGLLNGKY